ncbi:hypothetical protein EDC04DRAFT_440670 [Pisolithus marmoratus]|nr:hypothetical protein EDC04DRAFT_440670 [Pisolithus marmoratus]
MGLSLPNNQQLVLLLKAFSMRLAGKHLVATIIQCSDLKGVDGQGRRRVSPADEPGVFVPLCTIASPQSWRREPACAQRRELFKSIRNHFYTLANLHQPPGAEADRECVAGESWYSQVPFGYIWSGELEELCRRDEIFQRASLSGGNTDTAQKHFYSKY